MKLWQNKVLMGRPNTQNMNKIEAKLKIFHKWDILASVLFFSVQSFFYDFITCRKSKNNLKTSKVQNVSNFNQNFSTTSRI